MIINPVLYERRKLIRSRHTRLISELISVDAFSLSLSLSIYLSIYLSRVLVVLERQSVPDLLTLVTDQ